MGSESPPRLLDQPATMEGIGQRRGPVAFAVGLALVLLVGALIVQAAMMRAARHAVRGQGSPLVEAMRRDCRELGRPPGERELQRIVDAHDHEGLRYVATLAENDSIAAAAGRPMGHGAPLGDPQRFGKNLRVVVPSILPPEGLSSPPGPPPNATSETSAPPKLVFEFEPIAANDIAIAARVTLVVVLI